MTTKRMIAVLMFLVFMLSSAVTAYSQTLPYSTYIYDANMNELASPAAYVPYLIVDGDTLGIGKLKDPADFAVTDGYIFILDSGNNRIICVNRNYELVKVIDGFDREGTKETFKNPQGLAVTPEKELYVADTSNARIVKLDYEGNLMAIFNKPEVDVLGTDYAYQPTKIGVDRSKRVYVIAAGVNRGLMELDSTGQFMSFMGAPKVQYNLFDYFWKKFSTKEQRKRMYKFVPTEYSNLYIDEEGFTYVTTSAIDGEQLSYALKVGKYDLVKPVQRLNPTGLDVLRRNGVKPPVGDLRFAYEGTVEGVSAFVDITVDAYGTYSCLDSKRGRIFTYDNEGNLLHIFGGIGNQIGTFVTAVAIEKLGDQIAVLDKTLGRLTVFDVTEYGKCLSKAVQLHASGKYEEALKRWEEVAKFNANFSLAYVGIGKAYLRKNDYKAAMKYLTIADERKYNSKAFKKYRNEVMAKNFIAIFAGIAVLILIFSLWGYIRNQRGKERTWYGSDID